MEVPIRGVWIVWVEIRRPNDVGKKRRTERRLGGISHERNLAGHDASVNPCKSGASSGRAVPMRYRRPLSADRVARLTSRQQRPATHRGGLGADTQRRARAIRRRQAAVQGARFNLGSLARESAGGGASERRRGRERAFQALVPERARITADAASLPQNGRFAATSRMQPTGIEPVTRSYGLSTGAPLVRGAK